MTHQAQTANNFNLARGLVPLLLGVFLAFGVVGAHGQSLAAGAGISGTAHDFALDSTAAHRPVCAACHAPHGGSAQEPLWNPKLTTLEFSLYGSPTFVSPAGQPGIYSKLCLSCHDGTLAVLNYSGAKGSNLLAPRRLAGAAYSNKLSTRDHPIGVGYSSDSAVSDGSLADPDRGSVDVVATQASHRKTRSGSISMMMLAEGKVECTSCHDVHNRYTAGASSRGLVKVGLAGSALCLVCHEK
jgi:predicted CXXCH cytochrome family protein